MPGIPEMTCRELVQEVASYLEGALAPRDRERFEAHGDACPNCRLYLAEWRTLIDSLGRLEHRQKGTATTEKERLRALFREHGHHRSGPRVPSIPLGLDGGLVAPGDHFAYFWETDQEFTATAGFVAAGATQGEASVLLGHDAALERLAAAIGSVGLDVEALRRNDRLVFIADTKPADTLMEEIAEQIKSAVDRGAPLVRVLGNLGWGRPVPGDRELLTLEARVTDAVRKLPVAVGCAYEVPRVSGRILLMGGLECHPLVFRRRTLCPNALYTPAERFLTTLSHEPASAENDGRTADLDHPTRARERKRE